MTGDLHITKTRQWQGRWICSPTAQWNGVAPAPYLHSPLHYRQEKKVIVHLCGLGWHELWVNGKKADERLLSPTLSRYDQHVGYLDYDVTRLLLTGENDVTVLLGNGYYNPHFPGPFGFSEQYSSWRDVPKLLCDVEADGKVVACSGSHWECWDSPIVFDSMREGETYDARLEKATSKRSNARLCYPPGGDIQKESAPPCTVIKTYDPISSQILRDGSVLYDFGVGLTGWCKIETVGEAGGEVVLQYGETLDDAGQLDRSAIAKLGKDVRFQEDHYILKGADGETWQPRFTYHGFRYVRLTAVRATVTCVTAYFVASRFEERGTVATSNPMLDSLQKVTRQSYRANFTGIPTDCPHREKNGWTGDAWLTMEVGYWNYSPEEGYAHFLEIVFDCQRPNGQIPVHAPTSIWGYELAGPSYDAYIYETLWQRYRFLGDDRLIARYYPNLLRHAAFCERIAENGIISLGLGDWMHPNYERMNHTVLQTMFYYRNLKRLGVFAGLLHQATDQGAFQQRADEVRRQINAKFYDSASGDYRGGYSTAAAVALDSGIPEAHECDKILRRIIRQVRDQEHRAMFGIFGARFIPRVLSEHGYGDDAFKLFTQEKFPGWGYMIRQGATTLWETFGGTESRLHMMYGDVSAWLYEYAAGIHPSMEGPGFRHFRLAPCFVPQLNWTQARHQSPFGQIASRWKRADGAIHCHFAIPQGTKATVELPGQKTDCGPGEYDFTVAEEAVAAILPKDLETIGFGCAAEQERR
jgi:alpha-L-rhamnosidase